MDFVNDYFKKKTNKITFIELKKGARINIKGYPIDKDIPLPILTDVLVSEIIEGNMEEEIKVSDIIDGIIYLMGIDSLFMHMEDYKNILMYYNKKAEDYIFYKGIRSIEEDDYDNGAVYFRALKYINPKNVNGIFNYAIALEEIGKKYFEKEENEKGIKFLDKSTNELETILDIDDKYPLAYYKLGYHYKFAEQYLKAKLIWTKYLVLDKDELRLQEIRGEIELIENDVALETGLTYLSREYFDKALDIFLKLLPKLDKWWELKYLIGVCYKGLSDFENAIDYFEGALELYKLDSNLYNELGICLFTIGDINNAIDVFTEGIESVPDDYKLIFNRGLCYLQLGKLKDAYSDIENAVMLNPNDINMNTQKEALEKLMNK
ncbi:tetratricopeptide repeat protein [Tissierella praeacuta]|uniref:tetratricopeptide repeat protein n=1 Tax=Tissierella praeacuta TaxID=43131 RepID=UPI001C11D6F0|nr:tetratricopeptide repeat protein [Tissierella praeacuta]MBU5257406.1 tetratricopeptide repeat protein [Tissierella praeacuta]